MCNIKSNREKRMTLIKIIENLITQTQPPQQVYNIDQVPTKQNDLEDNKSTQAGTHELRILLYQLWKHGVNLGFRNNCLIKSWGKNESNSTR